MNDLINSQIKVLGISGYARSGKDTYVAIAKKILTRNGYIPIRIAFADKLKEEVESMLMANGFRVSVMTDDTEAKKLIRPLLVWWGCQRRYENSDGLYWVKKAEDKIKYYYSTEFSSEVDKIVFLISDVRFPNEAMWIHKIFNGDVIHLKKYKVITSDSPKYDGGLVSNESFIKVFDDAPNEEERKQDPIVRDMANQKINWEQSSSSDILNDPLMNRIVLESLNNTKYFKHSSNGILL